MQTRAFLVDHWKFFRYSRHIFNITNELPDLLPSVKHFSYKLLILYSCYNVHVNSNCFMILSPVRCSI